VAACIVPSSPLVRGDLPRRYTPVCSPRCGWQLPQSRPCAFGRRRGCVRVRNGIGRKHFPSAFAVPLSSGHTGPICGEQRTHRAWLPAPLVWTWVRAHRQLLAGNAGLRPATTSFPANPARVKHGSCSMQHPCSGKPRAHPLTDAGAMGLRTRRNALCSNSSCQ
jgi:hypothetical protein